MPDVGGSNFLPESNWSPLQSPDSSSVDVSRERSTTTRSRLVLYHALALVPAVVMLIALLWSTHATLRLCNMKLLIPGYPSESCYASMDSYVALLLFSIGAVSWLTAYSLRPVCWETVYSTARALWLVPKAFLCEWPSMEDTFPAAIAMCSAILRSTVVQGLQLLSHEVCILLVFAIAQSQIDPALLILTRHISECWTDVDDPRFPISLWLSAGWAFAEVIAGTWQMFKLLPMYQTAESRVTNMEEEELLDDYVHEDTGTEQQQRPADTEQSAPVPENDSNSGTSSFNSSIVQSLGLDELVLYREKTEMEQQLGEYLENVPAATIALWRIDSVLWNVGSCLILSAALAQVQGCAQFDTGGEPQPYSFVPFPSFSGFGLSFFTLVVVRTLATAIWMLALPYLGLTSITYTSMLIGLGLLFLGLARWDALV